MGPELSRDGVEGDRGQVDVDDSAAPGAHEVVVCLRMEVEHDLS